VSSLNRITANDEYDEPEDVSLVPVETVARMLDISVRSVWRLLSAGKLVTPRRLGRSVRWSRNEIREWIEAGCPPLVSPSRKR